MFRTMRIFTAMALLALGLMAGAQSLQRHSTAGTWFPEQDSGAPPEGDHVVLCKITGEIDDGIAVVVERAVKASAKAKALVFVIDTPGGRVDSAIEITRQIMEAPCPTYAYVEGMGAISAGALISYSCDYIVMGPATNIGASTPVAMGTEGMEAVEEKSMSFVRAKYRALGEEKGHNPLIGEAMVDSEIELYGLLSEDDTYTTYKVVAGQIVDTFVQGAQDGPATGGLATLHDAPALGNLYAQAPDPLDIIRKATGQPAPEAPSEEVAEPKPEPVRMPRPEEIPADAVQICDPATLLTLTTEEAIGYRLASIKADNVDQLFAYYGLPGIAKHYVVPTWAEVLFAWLTSPLISGLLLMVGVGGLYVEVRTPGLGLGGAVGAACLALFFGSHLVLGAAEWVDVALVVVGIVLLVVEVFYLPGFGIAGALGLASTILGLYLAMVRVPIPQYEWDFSRANDAGQTLVTAFVLLIAMVAITWKLLPRTPLAGWMVLNSTQAAQAGYVVQTEAEQALADGLRGVASTVLRPAGKARFDGRTYDVVTRGEYLEPGTAIRVIRADGNRYVVTAETNNDGAGA